MIHASQVKVKPKEIRVGIAFGQIVQHHILDEICKHLNTYDHTVKWTTVITYMKINAVTEQILKMYGYRINLADSLGNNYLYDIDWN